MEIIRFRKNHLEEAGEIAFSHWGNEHASADEPTRKLIYRYLVRYYFHPKSPFSLAAVDQEKLQALLLAHSPGCPAYPAAAWLEPQLNRQNRTILEEYTAYLDGNRLKEEALVRPGEVILALFASRSPGCGKLLLDRFSFLCRASGIASMLLWSDTSCDYTYYEKHGFEKIGEFPTDPAFDDRELTTFLYRKKF